MTTAGVGDGEVKRGGFHGNEELLREAAPVARQAVADEKYLISDHSRSASEWPPGKQQVGFGGLRARLAHTMRGLFGAPRVSTDSCVAPIDFSAQRRYSGADEPVGDRPARSSGDEQRAGAGDRSNAWVSRIGSTGTDSRATATPRSIATVAAVDRDRSTIPINDNRFAGARAGAQSVSCSFVLVWVGALRSVLVGAGQL